MDRDMLVGTGQKGSSLGAIPQPGMKPKILESHNSSALNKDVLEKCVTHSLLVLVHREDDNLLSVTLVAQEAEVCVVDLKGSNLLMIHIYVNFCFFFFQFATLITFF